MTSALGDVCADRSQRRPLATVFTILLAPMFCAWAGVVALARGWSAPSSSVAAVLVGGGILSSSWG
jgi:hypothetical protein